MINTAIHLNEVQLKLINIFSKKMSKSEQNDIENLLLTYYNNQLQKEIELVTAEKKITHKAIDLQLNQSQRTKF